MEASSWTVVNGVAVFASIAIWFIFLFIYTRFMITLGYETIGAFAQLYPNPAYWLTLLLTVAIALIPDFAYYGFSRLIHTSDLDVIKLREKRGFAAVSLNH